jgi:hypothetical protein
LWRQYLAEPTRQLSKFVDHIHAEKELVSGRPVVVSLAIPRVIEAKFRTEHNRRPDVSGEIKRIFRIFPGDPGTLPFLIVEQVGSESEHKLELTSRFMNFACALGDEVGFITHVGRHTNRVRG